MWDHASGMPEGINTDLVQHDWSLSGGQKQRLGIARAVYHGPSPYLFDDTFSAPDYRTDRDLKDALDAEISGVTEIVVTQRVEMILDADGIVVLDNERVVGEDRHTDLVKTCPLYREIAELQLEVS